jgi:hypothetical protein
MVKGFLPIADLKYVKMLAAHHGFDALDSVLAKRCGVTLYISTNDLSDKTRKLCDSELRSKIALTRE